MKKWLVIMISIVLVVALTACGGGGNSGGGDSGGSNGGASENQIKGVVETAGNLTVMVPESWTLEPGNAGGIEDNNSLFLLKDDSMSTYLWIMAKTQDQFEGQMEIGDRLDIEPFTTGDFNWEAFGDGIAAPIEGGHIMVMQYGLDYGDETVQAVLSSIQWNGEAE